MKLLINTSKLRFGGAIQVALSFIYECRNYNEHEYHIFVGQGVGKSLRKEEFPSNFQFYNFDFGTISLWKIQSMARKLSALERIIKPDCVVTTSGPSYWHSKAPHLMGFNLGLYIYNDSPYFNTISTYRKLRVAVKRKIHFWYFKRDATAFIVQTDDVNQRVRKALKTDKVFTVSNTYNGLFSRPIIDEINMPPRREGELRFLTLTSYYRHKNLEIIPSVIKELKNRGYNNISFILTLNNSTFKSVFKNTCINDIINVGPVAPEVCPSLYNACDYVFIPSLAECFSASYPEAMVMKKPIITTDLPFAHNICGNAAVFYKPMNVKSAADTIEHLINDRKLNISLIKNGLQRLNYFDSARERANKILEICKQVI